MIPTQGTEIFFNLPTQQCLGRKQVRTDIASQDCMEAPQQLIDDVVCSGTGLAKITRSCWKDSQSIYIHCCLVELLCYWSMFFGHTALRSADSYHILQSEELLCLMKRAVIRGLHHTTTASTDWIESGYKYPGPPDPLTSHFHHWLLASLCSWLHTTIKHSDTANLKKLIWTNFGLV